MSFLSSQSQECVKSELDLFSTPPTQTSIESGYWTEYHPVASLDTGGPIEFAISGSSEDYIDLAQSQVYVKLKITKGDGGNLDNDENVGPINLLLHSLFSQVDVSLNDKLISQPTNTYAYRAYLETLLNYGSTALDSHLTSSLWYQDTHNHMDSTGTGEDAENAGLVKRSRFARNSQFIDLLGRVHSDIFFQDRYMLNGVDLRLRFVRNKDAFILMSGENNAAYKIQMIQAVLRVRKVKISPSIRVAHAKALEIGPAKYPIHRVEMKVFSVPRGNFTVNQENLFMGQIPLRLIIGCVENEALNGSFTKNPYNFKHFSVNHLALHVDGQSEVYKPLQPNYVGQNFIHSFNNLFSGIGRLYKDEGIPIDRHSYAGGYTLYAFDLSPDLTDGGHLNLLKTGTVRLEIKFGAALPSTINVIVYAEFENIVYIDKNRSVVFDFGS